jgi:hypothetical protein
MARKAAAKSKARVRDLKAKRRKTSGVKAGNVSRIDSTPMRIANNVTIARQTPKTDFGDRMKAGLDTSAGIVAGGAAAAVVGGVAPGTVVNPAPSL